MGLFDSLFDRIDNENKTKPFYKCVDPTERKDWFRRTRPWHKVSPSIIDAVAAKLEGKKLEGNASAFELFVVTSMKLDMVQRYAGLDPKIGITATIVAGWLCQAAAEQMRQFLALHEAVTGGRGSESMIDQVVKHASLARDAYESALALDRNMIPGYGGLSTLLGLTGRIADGVKYGLDPVRWTVGLRCLPHRDVPPNPGRFQTS